MVFLCDLTLKMFYLHQFMYDYKHNQIIPLLLFDLPFYPYYSPKILLNNLLKLKKFKL